MSYYERNREWLLARQKAYYQNNKEYYNDYNADYFQTVTKPRRQQCMEILRQHNLLKRPGKAPKVRKLKEPKKTKEIPAPLVHSTNGCVIDWT
jgi:hypothetical protein